MALSHSDRAAADIAAGAAGSPVLLGYNRMRDLSAARWDADGDMSGGASMTAAGYPASRAYDDRLDLYTKPNAAAANQYFCVDLGSSGATFDSICLTYSVLAGTLGIATDEGGISCSISDTPGLGGHTLFEAWQAGSSDPFVNPGYRICVLNLNGATGQVFTGGRYLCVHFGGSATLVPAIHELWIGSQLQLPRRPMYPFEAENYRDLFAEYESDSGQKVRYLMDANHWSYNAEIPLTSSTERSTLTSWIGASKLGRYPLWVVANPTDTYNVGASSLYVASARARLCWLDDNRIECKRVNYSEWRLRLQASENGGRTLYDEEGTIQ